MERGKTSSKQETNTDESASVSVLHPHSRVCVHCGDIECPSGPFEPCPHQQQASSATATVRKTQKSSLNQGARQLQGPIEQAQSSKSIPEQIHADRERSTNRPARAQTLYHDRDQQGVHMDATLSSPAVWIKFDRQVPSSAPASTAVRSTILKASNDHVQTTADIVPVSVDSGASHPVRLRVDSAANILKPISNSGINAETFKLQHHPFDPFGASRIVCQTNSRDAPAFERNAKRNDVQAIPQVSFDCLSPSYRNDPPAAEVQPPFATSAGLNGQTLLRLAGPQPSFPMLRQGYAFK